ncbi:MAG: hypothetical protein IPK62_00130 [Bacteroidetes bacterium]|nr:hypothetical protein [Bacteroidota bacterium]
MKNWILVFMMAGSTLAIAQQAPNQAMLPQVSKDAMIPCDCNRQFEFVVEYIEANNPAFQILREDERRFNRYEITKRPLQEKSKQCQHIDTCLQFLKQYVGLLQDHHTNIFLAAKNRIAGAPGNDSTSPKSSTAFKEITDSIYYFRISSFDGNLENYVNHLYDMLFDRIQKTPYLIIDVRDNGGGNDACFHKLMKCMYTNPIIVDDVDVWVSAGNLNWYANKFVSNKKLIDRMNAAKPGSFVHISRNQRWIMDSSMDYPKRVYILQNRGVASSAEDFILYARQSNKVITVGTHTGGYTGFGNVMSVKTPEELFQLQTTTTKCKLGVRYEYVGIPPDILLNDFTDWENTIKRHIEQSTQ